ncbi:hypothetical protein ROA7745_03876 [Roseovarius aestuarii]|uniref:Uncharacterized protein n=1 Tax=Roseovarius aestuarii TaxID=475083 RepID=A0A1X7BWN1_9RHOB|nr:hypothetical protein ROA7745_03876 [Roseovarius aestuarii]
MQFRRSSLSSLKNMATMEKTEAVFESRTELPQATLFWQFRNVLKMTMNQLMRLFA